MRSFTTRHLASPLAVLCFLLSLTLARGGETARLPGLPQPNPIAIVGATIHTISGPVINGGTILFENGKITGLGTNLTLPANTEVLNAEGKHVYPGLISADTYLGLTEIGSVRASRDYNETGRINPNVRAEVAFNPESELIPVTRANGILTVVTAPRGGLISGLSAMMMLDGWTWEDMTLTAPVALNVQWPAMNISRRTKEVEEEHKKQREKNLAELSSAFRDARSYRTSKLSGRNEQEMDVRWEAMIPMLERRIPVVVWANEVQQIQAAVAWADQEGVRMILGGGNDAWRVADLLKRRDIPVLAGGIHRVPMRRFEAFDEPFTLPKKLHDAGIRFAIISREEAAHERNLPYQAAHAAAYGLPQDEALKAITLYPAQILGVADRIGSIASGKDATLIVTTGDPLEITTRVDVAFIQGRKVDLSSRHTMLYEKYKEKYRRLRGTSR